MAIQVNQQITDGSAVFTVRRKSHDPVGEIKMIGGGGIAIEGWLLCDGAAISRTSYADLFSVIGTSYGVGDGSTTFNLPNFTNRFPYGSSSVGVYGGEASHTLGVLEIPQLLIQMDSITAYYQKAFYLGQYIDNTDTTNPVNPGFAPTNGFTVGCRGGTAYVGTPGNQAHNNIPPYLTVRFIIRY